MDVGQFIALAGQYGPVGVLCMYLLWREEKRDKRESDRELRIEDIQKDRIKADEAMATSITLLTERLNRVRGL